MKKLLLIICLFVSLPVLSQELDGKWVDEKGLLTFTLTPDSLFIDTADSGCGLAAYQIVHKRVALSKDYVEYDAIEVYSQGEDETIYKRVLLEFKQLSNKIYRLNLHYMNEKKIYDEHETYYIKRIGT
jgi:hypothetical protein